MFTYYRINSLVMSISRSLNLHTIFTIFTSLSYHMFCPRSEYQIDVPGSHKNYSVCLYIRHAVIDVVTFCCWVNATTHSAHRQRYLMRIRTFSITHSTGNTSASTFDAYRAVRCQTMSSIRSAFSQRLSRWYVRPTDDETSQSRISHTHVSRYTNATR